MYCSAGFEESVDIWVGTRCVARAQHPDPDNRLHLFVAPIKEMFHGGEPLRFETNATSGPARIEDIVILPTKPRAARLSFDIIDLGVQVEPDDGGLRAVACCRTSRPATGRIVISSKGAKDAVTRLKNPRAIHTAERSRLKPGTRYTCTAQFRNSAGDLEAKKSCAFIARLPTSKGSGHSGTIALQRRRTGPAGWPVSVGAPFPEGALKDLGGLVLERPDGKAVPFQPAITGRWPDGSVRWALLDFSATTDKSLTLCYGDHVERPKPEAGLRVTRSRKGISVVTGPLKLTVGKDRTRLPGDIALRTHAGWKTITGSDAAVTLVDAKSRSFTSGKPESVSVEESGPERVCIRVEAVHKRGRSTLFRSTFRIHLFRGSSRIRIQHTFVNDAVDDVFTGIRSLSLNLPLKVGAVSGLSVDGRRAPGRSRSLDLRQASDNHYELWSGRKKIASGRRAEGAVHLEGADASVSLKVKDFWQNYPKRVAADRDGLTIDLCPEMDSSEVVAEGELEDRLYYHLQGGVYKLKRGVSRTHEFWLDVRPREEANDNSFAASVQSPPLYTPDLEAVNASGALPVLPGKAPSPYPPYEKWIKDVRKVYSADREESRAYGMLNFGDWFGERTYNWGNMEYDTPLCFFREYLRGGDPDFFTWGEEAAYHLIDVDTCHASDNPNDVGGQYIHAVGHVGDYYPEGTRERAIYSGRATVDHTWVEGLFLYHLLTGDRRALESALVTSERLLGRDLNNYDFTNCRKCGWHLIHLAAAYRATGRKAYLSAAGIIVERVLERQRPSGGWERTMCPGHCYCTPPRHRGNAGFMVGVLMVGLSQYAETTDDKRVAKAIVAAAEYCIKEMWAPEAKAFHYTSCPESSIFGRADMRILHGVAWANRYESKPLFRRILSEGITTAAGGGLRPHRGIGKSISMPMQNAPDVLAGLP